MPAAPEPAEHPFLPRQKEVAVWGAGSGQEPRHRAQPHLPVTSQVRSAQLSKRLWGSLPHVCPALCWGLGAARCARPAQGPWGSSPRSGQPPGLSEPQSGSVPGPGHACLGGGVGRCLVRGGGYLHTGYGTQWACTQSLAHSGPAHGGPGTQWAFTRSLAHSGPAHRAWHTVGLHTGPGTL